VPFLETLLPDPRVSHAKIVSDQLTVSTKSISENEENT
jgi:hypothetical protein